MEQLLQYTQNGQLYLLAIGALIFLSILSLLMFFVKIFQVFHKNRIKSDEHKTEEHAPDDIGIILKYGKVEYKGKKLKYFILKNKSYQEEKLPVGTKVKIIKKNDIEAYVKPL